MKENVVHPEDRQSGRAGSDTPSATVSPGSPLTLRTVVTDEAFDAIEETWNEVLDRSEATIFQTYEWQRTWWKYFGAGKKLLILLFERDGKTEGIAPLFFSKERLLGIPIAARLQFIGVGLSDYLSVIASRDGEADVLRSLAGWLASNRRQWDVFDLEDVQESSTSFGVFPSLLESGGLRVFRYHGTVCPRITLPASEEELMKSMGPSSNQNLKRKLKRLENHFRFTVRLVSRPDDPLDKAIEDFSTIHGERWKSQGHPSAFDDPYHRSFHAEVCGKLAGRDWLRLYFLDIADQSVAVSFSFNFRSTIYMYQSNASGPEEYMKCSPGLVIRWISMTRGIGEGMKVFDFMRGNEPYKYREWAAVDVKNWLIRSSSGTRAGTARFTLFLASEFLDKVVKRLMREFYDYRRYRLTGQDEEIPVPAYVMGKFMHLISMASHFITRHLPAGRKPSTTESTETRS